MDQLAPTQRDLNGDYHMQLQLRRTLGGNLTTHVHVLNSMTYPGYSILRLQPLRVLANAEGYPDGVTSAKVPGEQLWFTYEILIGGE